MLVYPRPVEQSGKPYFRSLDRIKHLRRIRHQPDQE